MDGNGDESPLKCEICSIEFSTMDSLTRHKNAVHLITKNEGTVKCENCQKTVKKVSWPKHKKRCYKLASFQCDTCEFEAVTRWEVKIHWAYRHSEERPFMCDECGRAFKTKCYLKSHGNTHLPKPRSRLKPKPKCDKCGKEFTRTSALTSHRKCWYKLFLFRLIPRFVMRAKNPDSPPLKKCHRFFCLIA